MIIEETQRVIFNKPPYTGHEEEYIKRSIETHNLCGGNFYSQECQKWFMEKFNCKKILLTPSCTAALELAAILIDIQPGDEVIMPSFTFVSTANAFVLRGAKIKFIDINPETMNLDETLIESAITKSTKAIVVVHYAGVSCEMDAIMNIANKHGVFVIEDAAQGVMSYYKNRPLGTIGHLGCYSFHETKNYTSGGEGGALVVNDDQFIERAEVIREKGTNRSQFLRGQIDKYTWRDIGSSFLLSDLQAAYLYPQLLHAEEIKSKRLSIWNKYHNALSVLSDLGKVGIPNIPAYCNHNAHIYYLKLSSLQERDNFINYMKQHLIQTTFHYIPLHSSLAGKKYGCFVNADQFTTSESERLVRLPLWYNMPLSQVDRVIKQIFAYFNYEDEGSQLS